MDPIFPLGPKEKQTLWQKVLNLPLKIKIAALFALVIVLGSVAAAFILRQASQSTPSALTTSETEQSPTDTPADQTNPNEAPAEKTRRYSKK